jgi:hypothetical protein
MDLKSSSTDVLMAPASTGAGGAALRLPGPEELPRVDQRLVRPETREEIVRGRRVVALPANPAHGDRHCELDYVIRAHVKEGYIGSTDLLTRSSVNSDFATDTCVRRAGIDPSTGARYLEELAFEIVNKQSLRDMTERAEELTARGVRRVIAIFVQKGEVGEWSAKSGGWRKLEPETMFSDPTLAQPFRVRELLDAAEADNAVARALVAKENPVIVKAQEDSRAKGHADGRAEGRTEGLRVARAAVRDLCEVYGVAMTPERQAALAEMDAAALDALRERLKRDRRWD